MYKRSISRVIERIAQLYPVVSITGPRQSGKTTIARTLFPQHLYFSLENLDIRHEARQYPREFLAKCSAGAIIDEIQHAPDLLSYLQQIVDEDQRPGRFIITGSQNFALSNTVSQSLAGRVGIITLLPLSLSELKSNESWQKSTLIGGYPKINSQKLDPHEFFPFYLQTYVERDARNLQNIGDLSSFKNFVQICAGHVGQVINYTSLAQDASISPTTARNWLSILEASYIVFTLPTYHKNLNKRRIKMPKLYFYDTGLACALLGFESVKQVDNYYRKGALFENLAVLEILKHRFSQGKLSHLSFWRDYKGFEVDLITEAGGSIQAIEIKSNSVSSQDTVKNIERFCAMEPLAKGYLIYNGPEGTYGRITLININDLTRLHH